MTPLLTVRDAIAQFTAELVALAPTPEPPLGYGRDLAAVTDVDDNWSEEDPESPLGIARALCRRITCRRGLLPDDKNYGIDVRDYLNRPTTSTELFAIAGDIRGEGEKDDRIERLTVDVLIASDLKSMTLSVQITPEDPDLEAFEATLAVTSVGAVVQAIGGLVIDGG